MQRTISKISLADECRRRAAECSETALQQEDPEFKREYSYLATMWRLIAMNSEETEFVQDDRSEDEWALSAPFCFSNVRLPAIATH